MSDIIVFGSLNLDHIWRVKELPCPGATISCRGISQSWGGKGSNQAVAASRMGGAVSLVSALKDDDAGRRYVMHLQEQNIILDGLYIQRSEETGTAQIYVDDHGENMIVIYAGANAVWTEELVRRILGPLLKKGRILLMQLEIPLVAVLVALEMAEQAGCKCVLNASPVNCDFPWGKYCIDTVIINEHECRTGVGREPQDLFALEKSAVDSFLNRCSILNLIITRGKESTFLISKTKRLAVPTVPVIPVDTVGAGDTFAGALVAEMASGADWESALTIANQAAALATREKGAQASMPSREDIDRFFRRTPTLQKKLKMDSLKSPQ